VTASSDEITRPWDHHIQVKPHIPDFVQDEETWHFHPGGPMNLVATCTCGDYRQEHAAETDPLDIAIKARDHIQKHPMDPKSIVQLGDGTVLLVMAVPGNDEGGEEEVHMTISVPLAVWEDPKKLDEFLGPIGSPMHFRMARQRQNIISHASGSHGVSVVPLVRLPDGPHEQAQAFQSMFDFLRGQPGDPGVVMFQGSAEELRNFTGFTGLYQEQDGDTSDDQKLDDIADGDDR